MKSAYTLDPGSQALFLFAALQIQIIFPKEAEEFADLQCF